MSIFKSALVALIIGFGSIMSVAVTATPAQAALTTLQQDVVDLTVARKAQLVAQMAPFQAIIDSPTSTAQEKNEARSEIQLARLRANQMDYFATIVTFLPENLLLAFRASFQREVSANVTLV